MKDSGAELPLPDNPAPHIVGWMHQLGWVRSNGMDRVALTLGDAAELHAIGARPNAWEASMISRMSAAFLAESRRAEKPNCPQPWKSERALLVDRSMEERNLRSVLG